MGTVLLQEDEEKQLAHHTTGKHQLKLPGPPAAAVSAACPSPDSRGGRNSEKLRREGEEGGSKADFAIISLRLFRM